MESFSKSDFEATKDAVVGSLEMAMPKAPPFMLSSIADAALRATQADHETCIKWYIGAMAWAAKFCEENL